MTCNPMKSYSCFLSLVLLLSYSSGAQANDSDYPKPDNVYKNSNFEKNCATASNFYLRNIGDMDGKPLALEYKDLQTPNEFTADWKEWHSRVSTAINELLGKSKRRIDADGKLVVCVITFVVSPEGKFTRARLDRSSKSKEFDNLALQIIHQLDGQTVLKFPQNPKQSYKGMSKTGRFFQNYGLQVIEKEKRYKRN